MKAITTPPAKYWDVPWNPMSGCSPISLGCRNCWAADLAGRFRGGDFGVKIHPERLDSIPRGKSKTIFVCNTGDLFHENLTGRFATEVFKRMAKCPQHRFLILTKRTDRMADIVPTVRGHFPDRLEHIWLGSTCENQKYADHRIPHLLRTPATNRWLSLEPLLGGINLFENKGWLGWEMVDGISWVVVGAESGPNRRPCKIEWVRSIVDQCQNANVPVFVKQLDIDGKCVHDIEKFPADLQIRQFPWEVAA